MMLTLCYRLIQIQFVESATHLDRLAQQHSFDKKTVEKLTEK